MTLKRIEEISEIQEDQVYLVKHGTGKIWRLLRLKITGGYWFNREIRGFDVNAKSKNLKGYKLVTHFDFIYEVPQDADLNVLRTLYCGTEK